MRNPRSIDERHHELEHALTLLRRGEDPGRALNVWCDAFRVVFIYQAGRSGGR